MPHGRDGLTYLYGTCDFAKGWYLGLNVISTQIANGLYSSITLGVPLHMNLLILKILNYMQSKKGIDLFNTPPKAITSQPRA